MPKFVITEGDSEVKVMVRCEMNDRKVSLRMTNLATHDTNLVATLRCDGTIKLHELNRSWAKEAGIQTDGWGRIQLAS